MEARTRRVACKWPVTLQLPIEADAVAGLYLVKLIRDDGWGVWVPLVVADDRPADVLFQASVTTWQACNDWGGASLYRNPTNTLAYRRAVEVSFDRPYSDGVGAGQVLKWEVHLARFLEKAGYDASYTTNVAVAAHDGAWLAERGAFLSAGHDEYWSKSQRDALEDACSRGVPLLFFSANTGYWQVRFGDDAGHGARTMTGFKEVWRDDPHQDAM